MYQQQALVISLFLLGGYFIGQIGRKLNIPSIPAYIFAGVLMGPYVLPGSRDPAPSPHFAAMYQKGKGQLVWCSSIPGAISFYIPCLIPFSGEGTGLTVLNLYIVALYMSVWEPMVR